MCIFGVRSRFLDVIYRPNGSPVKTCVYIDIYCYTHNIQWEFQPATSYSILNNNFGLLKKPGKDHCGVGHR